MFNTEDEKDVKILKDDVSLWVMFALRAEGLIDIKEEDDFYIISVTDLFYRPKGQERLYNLLLELVKEKEDELKPMPVLKPSESTLDLNNKTLH